MARPADGGERGGTTVDRQAWRLVGAMHIAETKEQAYRDVEHGIVPWFRYFQHVAAFPQMDVGQGTNVRPTTGLPPTGSGAASSSSPVT